MRWLIVHPGPAFSVADVYAGWREALTDLGQQVAVFNLDDRLTFYASALREVEPGAFAPMLPDTAAATRLAADGIYADLVRWRPDVLLVVSAMFVPTAILDHARRLGVRTVVVHTESPYEDDRQLQVAAHADINLVNDPTNLTRFREVAATWYVPHAYRPSVHHLPVDVTALGDAEPRWVDGERPVDVAFIGTGFASRVAFLEQVESTGVFDGRDVLLGGNWQVLPAGSPLRRHLGHPIDECVDNADTADAYRRAKVGINLYRREANQPGLANGWAMGPREVEMAACGLPFVRDPRGEGDEVLHMLPRFADATEAADQLRWLLDNDDVRADLARQAREAIAPRTFKANAAGLLRRLDK